MWYQPAVITQRLEDFSSYVKVPNAVGERFFIRRVEEAFDSINAALNKDDLIKDIFQNISVLPTPRSTWNKTPFICDKEGSGRRIELSIRPDVVRLPVFLRASLFQFGCLLADSSFQESNIILERGYNLSPIDRLSPSKKYSLDAVIAKSNAESLGRTSEFVANLNLASELSDEQRRYFSVQKAALGAERELWKELELAKSSLFKLISNCLGNKEFTRHWPPLEMERMSTCLANIQYLFTYREQHTYTAANSLRELSTLLNLIEGGSSETPGYEKWNKLTQDAVGFCRSAVRLLKTKAVVIEMAEKPPKGI